MHHQQVSTRARSQQPEGTQQETQPLVRHGTRMLEPIVLHAGPHCNGHGRHGTLMAAFEYARTTSMSIANHGPP
eukprot:4421588-Pyramimonas_sp.AAC.1